MWGNPTTSHSELFIFGDFNLHLDRHSSITTMFVDIITSFDLKQRVSFLTHIHDHWLDLLITRLTCSSIQKPIVSDRLSDHLVRILFGKHFLLVLNQLNILLHSAVI